MLKINQKLDELFYKMVLLHCLEKLDEYASNAWKFHYKKETDQSGVKMINYRYVLSDESEHIEIRGKVGFDEDNEPSFFEPNCIKCRCEKNIGDQTRFDSQMPVCISIKKMDSLYYNKYRDFIFDHIKKNSNYSSMIASFEETDNTKKNEKEGVKKNNVSPPKKREVINESPIIHVEDLIVRGLSRCVFKEHNLKPIKASVLIDRGFKSGKTNIVPYELKATFCSECDIYFIGEDDFRRMMLFGFPCCKVIDEKVYRKQQENTFEWNAESVLRSYGYSVSSQIDLTEAQRRKILSFVIENKIMTRYQCINHLEFLINIRAGQNNMLNAIQKWESDIDFLKKYEPPTDSIVVNSIYRKRIVYR